MGQVEFKDFLWEALLDPAAKVTMGDTAENLARQYQITRKEVDAFAARTFDRALAAQKDGFLDGEIVPVTTETFELPGYEPRGIKLSRKTPEVKADTHVRPSPVDALAKIPPAFGGVQTGGNSSAIVDGAAAALVANSNYLKKNGKAPLARIVASAVVGVPPEVMGIGPVPAIKAVLERAGLKLSDIDRFEINEAFGAQVMACARELGIDENKLNVNGGAIAIGHPLGATGIRLTDHARARTEAQGPALRHLLGLHRRRPGHRAVDRESGRGLGDGTRRPWTSTDRPRSSPAALPGSAPRPRKSWRRRAPRSRCSTSMSTAARAVADKIGGIAVKCDVTDEQSATDALARGAEDVRRRARPGELRRHRPGRSASSAATGRCRSPIYSKVIDINLIGTFNMMRLFAADTAEAEPLPTASAA